MYIQKARQFLYLDGDRSGQGNTATGLRQFGVLIDQSYPDTLGTPGTGVILSVSTTILISLASKR